MYVQNATVYSHIEWQLQTHKLKLHLYLMQGKYIELIPVYTYKVIYANKPQAKFEPETQYQRWISKLAVYFLTPP